MITTGTCFNRGMLLSFFRSVQPSRVGHHDVERDQREWLRGLFGDSDRGVRARCMHHREALGLELDTDQLRGFIVALDHERGPRACGHLVRRRRRRYRRLEREVFRRSHRNPDGEA